MVFGFGPIKLFKCKGMKDLVCGWVLQGGDIHLIHRSGTSNFSIFFSFFCCKEKIHICRDALRELNHMLKRDEEGGLVLGLISLYMFGNFRELGVCAPT